MRRPKRCGADRIAFTLIELMVVIIIILVVTSMSLVFLGPFLRGSEVKYSGQIVFAAFSKARQYAGQKRRGCFIGFEATKNDAGAVVYNTINFYEDTNNDGLFQPPPGAGTDQRINEQPQRLPGLVRFMPHTTGNLIVPFTLPLYTVTGQPLRVDIVGVRPDGTLQNGIKQQLRDGVSAWTFDQGLTPAGTPAGDIILQPADPTSTTNGDWTSPPVLDTVCIDLDPQIGIIRKVEYVRTAVTRFP